jgi:DNA-directed RNA polymerase subunit RPC12/RpoP
VYDLGDLPAPIVRRITVHPVSGCWIVGGKPSRSGHARIGGRSAARVVWEHLVGPVDPKHDVDHREDLGCLSKACVFPSHLRDVTHFENMTRAGARGVAAANIRKTHCGRCGAELDLLNTYFHGGRRDCRRCISRRVAEYRKRHPERVRATRRRRRQRQRLELAAAAQQLTLFPDTRLGRAA